MMVIGKKRLELSANFELTVFELTVSDQESYG